MNPFALALERLAIGPEIDSADEILIGFRNGCRLSRRNMCEGILVVANIGGGKTTLSRTLYGGMLRDGFGGLILTVKPSQIEDFRAICENEGRLSDLRVIGRDPGVVFNPLEGEPSSAEAAAIICELSEVIEGKSGGGENESFWRQQQAIALRNLFTLCRIGYGRHDFLLAAELFASRANTLADVADPVWQERSAMAQALAAARLLPSDSDALLAIDYFERAFPTHGDRLQGSLAASLSGVLDYLCRPPLRTAFSGNSTFRMDDLFDHGRILVVGLPVLESASGRIANALMQYCFCRSATRRARNGYSFLISDEAQETVTRSLVQKLALLREFKVCPLFATQNIAVLDDRLGENLREAFCGLAGLKIFGPQGHASTRQWAAEQCGKIKVPVETESTGRSRTGMNRSNSTGTSIHRQWDYKVPPTRFAHLTPGQTICLRAGKVWWARWHKESPGKAGTVWIAFGNQDPIGA